MNNEKCRRLRDDKTCLQYSHLSIPGSSLPPQFGRLLFSPNDPDDLARQVLIFLKNYDLSKRLADSAIEHALTKFTWHEAQKKLVRVYGKLLS